MTQPALVSPGSGAPSPADLGRIAKREFRLIHRAPATLCLLLLFWACAISTRALIDGPSTAVLQTVGASVQSLLRLRLLNFVSSAGWADGIWDYVIATLLLAVAGFVIERKWGSVRLLWVGLVTQFFGVALGLATVELLSKLGSEWAAGLTETVTIGPWPLLVGLVMAFSATTAPLWRRRIRLGTIAVVLGLTLYEGHLDDVLRLAAAVVGLLLGILVLKRAPYPRTLRSARRETRAAMAVTLLATAIGPILVAINNRAAGPLAVLRYILVAPQIGPADFARVCGPDVTTPRCDELTRQLRFHGSGPFILSLLPSLLVILLAYGLKKGRRFAWWGAIALHILLTGLALTMFVQWLEFRHAPQLRTAPFFHSSTALGQLTPVLVPLIVVIVLLLTRRAFDIPAPSGTYRHLLRLLGNSVVALFVVYVGGSALIADQFSPKPSVGALIADFPLRLAPPGYLGMVDLTFVPTTTLSTLLFEWTGITLWAIAIGGVIRSFNASRLDTSVRDNDYVRGILEQHGRNALSYLTTWDGNNYWFNAGRTSYVAYRVQSGVAITMGDPIGPESEMVATMADFAQYCATRSWTVCFYSTTEAARNIGAGLGWQSVQVAEEAFLPLGKLAFTGKKFQDIRTASSRAAREGITSEWISFPTAPLAVSDQITAISEEWVATKGLPEMGFTLGGIDEIDDPAVRCLIAVDPDRLIHGITSWLPVYRDGRPVAWTLDYMRRRSSGFKGVMEFLISTAALQFQQEGAEFVSLSGAPLARAEQGPTPTLLQRLLDRTGHSLEPVYGFRSLLNFKAKFQPMYRPLYLIYPESAALPRIGNAISRAYLPHLSLMDGLRLLRKLKPAKKRSKARPQPADQVSPTGAS